MTAAAKQTAATSSEPSGQLNPDWAEALMGVPIGYTNPDCDEPVEIGDWPAWMGEEQKAWEPPRLAPGTKYRKERLTGIGGGVVPQVGYLLGLWIREAFFESTEDSTRTTPDTDS